MNFSLARHLRLWRARDGFHKNDNQKLTTSENRILPPPLGFGVPACTVDTGSELAGALCRALAERGPDLIEAMLA
ncbi:MAG: hypothetical protein R6V60_00765 [Desulfobacterales bacterium]